MSSERKKYATADDNLSANPGVSERGENDSSGVTPTVYLFYYPASGNSCGGSNRGDSLHPRSP